VSASSPLPPESDGHPELAVAWVLHGLEPEEDAAFAAHLSGCDGCRRLVAEAGEVTTLLGSAVEQVDPPSSLRDRIVSEAVRDARDVSDGASLTPDVSTGTSSSARNVVPLAPRRSGERMRRATAGLAVAAVLALVVAIGGLVAANRSLTEERDAAAARSASISHVVDAASRPGTPHAVLATPDGGFVGLVVDEGQGPELLASGLAPNDGEHTYVLWGLADGTPVGLTAFGMSGSGPVVQSVPSGEVAGRFAGFAVSLEPGRTVPATPTRVVASGQTAG
jgi:hypothetical protein